MASVECNSLNQLAAVLDVLGKHSMVPGKLNDGKSPVSVLKEAGTKCKTLPIYEEVQPITADLPVHPKTFAFKVTMGEYTAIGEGSSKKKARHSAAHKVLVDMWDIEEMNPGVDNTEVSKNPKTSWSNPIGELDSLTHRLYLPRPVYELSASTVPPYPLSYTCTARVHNLAATAVAGSRKAAKREVAQQMLQLVQCEYTGDKSDGGKDGSSDGVGEVISEEGEGLVSEKGNEISTEEPVCLISDNNTDAINRSTDPGCTDQQPSTLHSALPTEGLLHPSLSQPGVWKGLVKRAKLARDFSETSIQTCHGEKNDQSENCKERLSRIFENVKYFDIAELNMTGLHQCLAQIYTRPVIVCHGAGRSLEAAQESAAMHALEYIKLYLSQSFAC